METSNSCPGTSIFPVPWSEVNQVVPRYGMSTAKAIRYLLFAYYLASLLPYLPSVLPQHVETLLNRRGTGTFTTALRECRLERTECEVSR